MKRVCKFPALNAKKLFPLFITLLVSPLNVVAEHEGSHFVIGELNHPRVNNFYKPLIERAYRSIGIEVTFEKVGGERGLRLLAQGMTDADVVRFDVVAQHDNNIVIVPPALSHGASFLLCIRGAKCSKDVIENPDNAIAATTSFFVNMGKQSRALKANIFEFDDFHHVIDLLLSGRFDYAIMPSDFAEEVIFRQLGIEFIPLVEHKIVHVIHKKHSHLIGDLSEAIARELALSSQQQN